MIDEHAAKLQKLREAAYAAIAECPVVARPNPIKMKSGLTELARLGFTTALDIARVKYALNRWKDGEEDRANLSGYTAIGEDNWNKVKHAAIFG